MSYTLEELMAATGLTRQTLRVWLRGYRILGPRRETYTQQHVEKLRLVDLALRAGHPIDLVAQMSRRELSRLLSGRKPDDYLADALEALQAIDAQALALCLRQAALRLPLEDFLQGVIGPLLEAVGRFWERGTLTVATEHLVSVVVRSELGRLYEAGEVEPDAPVIVITTPAGHRHELGALMAALVAHQAGWRAVYLGSDLPTRDILHMTGYVGARGLAMSAVYPREDRETLAQLTDLRERLPSTVDIFLGGQASHELGPRTDALGVLTMSLPQFEEHLRADLRV